jgi:cysteine-S-conjugate beta-lyase
MADIPMKPDTILTHAGSEPGAQHGAVNPPVYHASTIIWPTVAALEAGQASRYDRVTYGRYGTPTTFAFEEAVAAVQGGYRAIALGSGAAACFAAILAHVKAGDHVLIPDSVYGPVRGFATGLLARFGVEATFYDPLLAAEIAPLLRDTTKLIYLESPGSITFEVQDVPALVALAKARGIVTICDNTWGAPLFFKPLALGVDVEVIAATKYIVGHSDAMMGLIVCSEPSFRRVRETVSQLGHHAAPDDCYLALRGLRTAGVRMRQHQAQGLALAHWLASRAEVERVLHPAFPSCPGHALWRRDFSGASGLFSIILRREYEKPAVAAMLDGMSLFRMGFSWGGYESLMVPVYPGRLRTAKPWDSGAVLRLHAGLEDQEDLIADLERGFRRLGAPR